MQPITIIVACHNGAATLARALDSCLAQPEAERILVVDDGSTDASANIARVHAMREPRVRLVQMPDSGGAARARNWGALQTATPYIAFLDAGDEYLPHALAAAHSHLERHPHEAAIRLDVEYAGFPDRLATHPDFARHTEAISNTVPSSLVIRRGAFLALGGFPMDETFRRHGGEEGAFAWALSEVFGQRRLIDAKRVRLHYRAGMPAERHLSIQLGLSEAQAALQGETQRASQAYFATAMASVQQTRELGLRSPAL
ncbi:glycosyltransferase family 2 protein [Paraburkholderia acidiphila]|uniref:Glycosyltransferase n=1 Tax=Paraburkholderia acidiphila TaxID=2571747 RepID=A0A7Z2G606_9BURK|nr:glycosyltransferase family A protein [Paraburkholderia acidiphila]QGZ55858.1 glycosyltransferase [Paraburkholderia acidiphila]